MRIHCLTSAASLAVVFAIVAPATAERESLECAGMTAAFAAEINPSGRQYAPSREIDLLHLALDVTPDFQQRSVSGTATLRFKPIAQPLAELALDAVDLRVASVTSPEKILGWQATDRQLIVTFAEPVPAGREASVTIRYSAEPKQGLYFRTPEMGYPARDTHLFTQGEAIEARHWFPCFDAPNEKFTSEITCRVPAGHDGALQWPAISQTNDRRRPCRRALAAGQAARQLPDFAGGRPLQEGRGHVPRHSAGLLHAGFASGLRAGTRSRTPRT